ncbi:MAG: trimethylamine methyltransferase family protein [Geminicoccaceae bacterium]
MTEARVDGRRRGGRNAKRAERAMPLAEAVRPVWPGLEGGRYAPLSAVDISKIHNAALDTLEQVGFADAIPSCIEMTTAAGAFVNDHGRLCFPRVLVEDTIAKAARHFPLFAQNPKHDMEPFGKRIYFGTAGAAVHIVDPVTGEYRDSTLNDLFDIARLVDSLDHVHFFQRSIVARDMVEPRDLDLNTCYAAVTGTTKHVGTSFTEPGFVDETLAMLHMIASGEAKWRERPFVSMSNCFVVPPMKFATDACRCLEAGVRGGLPVLLLAAGQAGATSPASLVGAIVQQVAEVLGGLVYVNCIKPGAPAIFGPWPFVSDLRTGAMSGGSGEQALLMAACAQMAHYYDLTGGVCAGMTDSKVADAQAGYEKGYNYALVANAGANLIYESAGMHASLLGFCFESLVIDNDAIGATLRTVRGIEVTDEALSLDVIRDACIGGPGHFLGSAQTLDLMQSAYVYPTIGDRTSPKEWLEQGSTDVVQKAIARTKETLESHYPGHIHGQLDRALRDRFDIKLPAERMRPSPPRPA